MKKGKMGSLFFFFVCLSRPRCRCRRRPCVRARRVCPDPLHAPFVPPSCSVHFSSALPFPRPFGGAVFLPSRKVSFCAHAAEIGPHPHRPRKKRAAPSLVIFPFFLPFSPVKNRPVGWGALPVFSFFLARMTANLGVGAGFALPCALMSVRVFFGWPRRRSLKKSDWFALLWGYKKKRNHFGTLFYPGLYVC